MDGSATGPGVTRIDAQVVEPFLLARRSSECTAITAAAAVGNRCCSLGACMGPTSSSSSSASSSSCACTATTMTAATVTSSSSASVSSSSSSTTTTASGWAAHRAHGLASERARATKGRKEGAERGIESEMEMVDAPLTRRRATNTHHATAIAGQPQKEREHSLVSR